MVGPKPVRPSTAKSSFEKPAEGKISKKPKKPVAKAVTKIKSETKPVSKTPAKAPSKKNNNKDVKVEDESSNEVEVKEESSNEVVTITDDQVKLDRNSIRVTISFIIFRLRLG